MVRKNGNKIMMKRELSLKGDSANAGRDAGTELEERGTRPA